MAIYSQLFLLVCVIGCSLDQGHSIPSHLSPGPSPYTSEVTKSVEKKFSECGKSRKTETDKLSIVNGTDAILGDWPWMVGLFFQSSTDSKSEFQCGGSLISRQWVITAAHCLEKNTKITVRLGDLDINDKVKDGAAPLDVQADRLVPHPKYSSHPYANDIALIRMKNPVHFTENIRPICLFNGKKYKGDEYYYDQKPFIIGWGNLEYDGTSPTRLQEASVDTIQQDVCKNDTRLTESFVIDEKVICAGETEKSSCQGDSGGPLIFLNQTEERFYLGGITSAVIRCSESAGVYTKVAQFIGWINKVTGEGF